MNVTLKSLESPWKIVDNALSHGLVVQLLQCDICGRLWLLNLVVKCQMLTMPMTTSWLSNSKISNVDNVDNNPELST